MKWLYLKYHLCVFVWRTALFDKVCLRYLALYFKNIVYLGFGEFNALDNWGLTFYHSHISIIIYLYVLFHVFACLFPLWAFYCSVFMPYMIWEFSCSCIWNIAHTDAHCKNLMKWIHIKVGLIFPTEEYFIS